MEKEFLVPFLKAVIPEYDWILSDMEKSGGWLNLNENLIQNAISLNLEWWKAYEDAKLFNIYRLLMLLDLEDIKAIKTKEQAEQLNHELTTELTQYLKSEEYQELSKIEPLSDEEKNKLKKEVEKWLSELSHEEQEEHWREVSFYWLGFFAVFFDLLALMIHGKSIRQLVIEVGEGNDDAFVQAVQTDRTVLFLPVFQKRLVKSQLGRDIDFLDKLGYRFKNPLIRTKSNKRTLWLLFALLESEGMLDLSGPELMNICKEVGVYGDVYGNGDLRSLRKRRKEYFDNRGSRKYF